MNECQEQVFLRGAPVMCQLVDGHLKVLYKGRIAMPHSAQVLGDGGVLVEVVWGGDSGD